MNGIDEIVAKVLEGAAEEREQILESARVGAQDVKREYDEKLAQKEEVLWSAAARVLEEKNARAQASLAMQKRTALLQEKTALIDDCIDRVQARLSAGYAGEYRTFFLRLFCDSLEERDGEMVFSDSDEMAESFYRDAQALLAERHSHCTLKLVRDPQQSAGGFSLRYGEIRISCDASAVVSACRTRLQARANELLFSGEEK